MSASLRLVSFVSILAALLAGSLVATELEREELEISAMNGVYENLDAGLVPIQQGPVTLVIRSPEHQLRVHRNRLGLSRSANGVISADFAGDVEGWGQLIIEVRSAGTSSRFDDHVEVPRQWLTASGTVRLEPSPEGWTVTFLDYVHDVVGVQIRSQATKKVVDSCRTMVSLGFLVLNCDSVQASLARAEVPLPEKGSQLVIRRELLTDEEQRVFDRFAAP